MKYVGLLVTVGYIIRTFNAILRQTDRQIQTASRTETEEDIKSERTE